jgi:hypothetical protein
VHNGVLANFVLRISLVVQVDDIIDLGIAIGIKVIDDLVIFIVVKLIFVIIERREGIVVWWRVRSRREPLPEPDTGRQMSITKQTSS